MGVADFEDAGGEGAVEGGIICGDEAGAGDGDVVEQVGAEIEQKVGVRVGAEGAGEGAA